MKAREPLSLSEKEAIWKGKLAGERLSALAERFGCCYACARKWWRVARDQGQSGLQARRRGRGQRGTLSRFAPEVGAQALALKRAHPRWGADRVLVELRHEPTLAGLPLPSRSRLHTHFKAHLPVVRVPAAPPPRRVAALPAAQAAHEEWQLDQQEKHRLNDGSIATLCTIRDPYAAALIASRAFAVQKARHYRKLTWQEIRSVLRSAFSEWQTLPDRLRTDNELALAGAPSDPYPSKLTLWLAGLGVQHLFIRPGQPTDQAQVERSHRTLAAWTEGLEARRDLLNLQQALDHERARYNQDFPARASTCHRQAPLRAFPTLLQPRRVFHPAAELALFDLQRVFDYLATFTFTRKVSSNARVSLGGQMYTLGRSFVRSHQLQTVLAQVDPTTHEWVFATEQCPDLLRRPVNGLSVLELTGLRPPNPPLERPIQLAFPVLAPRQGVRLL